MNLVLGTVAVNAAGTGCVALGALPPSGVLRSVIVWTDRSVAGVAGALLTAEVGFFNRLVDAVAYVNPIDVFQAAPIPFATDGAAHQLPLWRPVNDRGRFVGICFRNGTGANFNVSAGLELLG